jgi:Tol biopolymer transport system component
MPNDRRLPTAGRVQAQLQQILPLCSPAPLLTIFLLTLISLVACGAPLALPEPKALTNILITSAPISQPLSQPVASPTLRQLTQEGCCVQPTFSPDGQEILFIDQPDPASPTSVYAVDIAKPQKPLLREETIGFRNTDRTIVATREGDLARFTNETSGQSWTINTGGNWPRFSPDDRQVLWIATDREGPFDRRTSDIWLANLDGSNAKKILTVYGGGFAGWFPDSRRVLFIGRDNPNDEELILFVYDLKNERRTNLFAHKRLRGGEISRNGSWVTVFLTFAEEPSENGLWLISTDGTTQRQLTLPRFGGYRWQDDDTLLFIPMRASTEASMQLWAIDAPTGQMQPLTDPETLVFSISNGDWDVSPNGQHVVFVSSADQSIWLITLP